MEKYHENHNTRWAVVFARKIWVFRSVLWEDSHSDALVC